MEENLLKYFTGNGEPTTEDIKPQEVELTTIPCERMPQSFTLKSKDEQYFIKYGGWFTEGWYNAIEIYDINKNLINKFDDITINTYPIEINNLHQDEDGRFYGIGRFLSSDVEVYYLILFNNFLQDNELIIRKYYTPITMGITVNEPRFESVIKDTKNAVYYIKDTYNYKVYKFSIDILNGNSLQTLNIIDNGFNTSSYSSKSQMFFQDDKLIYLLFKKDYTTNRQQYLKGVIDKNYDGNSIVLNPIRTTNISDANPESTIYTDINNLTYKYGYYLEEQSKYKFCIDFVDLEGNSNTVTINELFDNTATGVSVSENYIFREDGNNLKAYMFKDYLQTPPIKFLDETFTGYFTYPQILRVFNINVIMGIGGNQGTTLSYLKFINSVGYSSIPYYNNNFMIPQYLNLYSASNDNTSLVFSRDASNRFVAGNQLTAMFNIPNYLLNNETIHREIVNGQTNLAIENDTKPYSKNRFESLYMTYMYNMYIKDNTNGDNLINMEGSNRLADSVWKTLDYQQSPCLKARITYDDETQEIITLTAPTIVDTTATYTYQVEGNIVKIEYLSNDTNTVYATYRCNLTGTNTITQTITIEEG